MCLPLDKLQSDGANKTTRAREGQQEPPATALVSVTCLRLRLGLSPFHPHLLLSAYFLPHSLLRRREAAFRQAVGPDLLSVAVNAAIPRFFKNAGTSSRWQILVNNIQPSGLSSLIIKIHEPACQHVKPYRYESYIYARISIFLHLDIDSCSGLAFCDP